MKLIQSIFFAFCFILSSSVWTSCSSSPYTKKDVDRKDSDKKVTGSQNPYFPVSAGSQWEFINEAPREETKTYKVEIISAKYEGNDELVEFNSFPFFSKEEKPAVLRIKTSGAVYSIDKDLKENLLIPGTEDLRKDFSWEFGQWRGSVSMTNETVNTETGTYENCLYLNFTIYFTFSAELWLAKDAGIIKWGYNRTNPPTLKPEYYVLKKLNLAK